MMGVVADDARSPLNQIFLFDPTDLYQQLFISVTVTAVTPKSMLAYRCSFEIAKIKDFVSEFDKCVRTELLLVYR